MRKAAVISSPTLFVCPSGLEKPRSSYSYSSDAVIAHERSELIRCSVVVKKQE